MKRKTEDQQGSSSFFILHPSALIPHFNSSDAMLEGNVASGRE